MIPVVELPLVGETRTHALMVLLAALAAATLGATNATRFERLPAGRVIAAIALIAAAVFIGGRLHFALLRLRLFSDRPLDILRISSGGLHAPGAICGGVIGGWFGLRALGLPVGRFADAFAPAVGLGIGIARLGCFLNGCCYGDLCTLPWGLSMPAGSLPHLEQIERGLLAPDAPRSLPVHPLPLYFSLAALALAALFTWVQPRKSRDGQIALWFLFLFSLTSGLLEPLRTDHEMRVYWGSMPQLQWVTLAMTLAAAAALAWQSRGSRTAGRSRRLRRRLFRA